MHEPCLDEAQITALRSLDPDGSAGLLSVLFTEFKQQADGMVQQLGDAWSDSRKLAAVSHAHKGAAASMGARALATQLKYIETLARAGEVPNRQALDDLPRLLDTTMGALAIALGLPPR